MDMINYNNVGEFQLQPYYYHHHPDDPRLMMAEHYQQQPLVVHNPPAFILEPMPPDFKFRPTDIDPRLMMAEHHQQQPLVVHNPPAFILEPMPPGDIDPRLMMAEHHQQQPLVVHNPPAFILEPMPPGFKFRPTDIELIEFYLKPKLQNFLFPPEFKKPFLDVQLYQHNPEELVGMHEQVEVDQESWYFFTPRERKYQKGSRPQRIAAGGYWKATAKDTTIVGNGGAVVGYKKTLDYYKGKPQAGGDHRSEWKMHEYLTKEQKDHPNLPTTNDQNPTKYLNDWVLCKIYKNHRGTKRKAHPDEEIQQKDEIDERIDSLLKDDYLFKNIDFVMSLPS